jgi:thiol:disulfide interchange protein DsbD
VARLRADWTRRDPQITAELARWGRSGVPLYLYFPAAGQSPQLLPELLSDDIVLAALRR